MPYIIYNSSIQSLSAYNPLKDKEKINEVIFYLCSSVKICGLKIKPSLRYRPDLGKRSRLVICCGKGFEFDEAD